MQVPRKEVTFLLTKKPYSEKLIYDLLVSSCGVKDKRSLKYLRGIAKIARKAYLMGQRESQEGKPMLHVADSTAWINLNCRDSDLAKSACEFVYEVYHAGYLAGGGDLT